jgi:hypothetical protein
MDPTRDAAAIAIAQRHQRPADGRPAVAILDCVQLMAHDIGTPGVRRRARSPARRSARYTAAPAARRPGYAGAAAPIAGAALAPATGRPRPMRSCGRRRRARRWTNCLSCKAWKWRNGRKTRCAIEVSAAGDRTSPAMVTPYGRWIPCRCRSYVELGVYYCAKMAGSPRHGGRP